jgi:hypothetical protein
LEDFHRVVRDDLDVVEVAGRARKAVADREDESAQAMQLNGTWKEAVHVLEKLTPGRT